MNGNKKLGILSYGLLCCSSMKWAQLVIDLFSTSSLPGSHKTNSLVALYFKCSDLVLTCLAEIGIFPWLGCHSSSMPLEIVLCLTLSSCLCGRSRIPISWQGCHTVSFLALLMKDCLAFDAVFPGKAECPLKSLSFTRIGSGWFLFMVSFQCRTFFLRWDKQLFFKGTIIYINSQPRYYSQWEVKEDNTCETQT